ncbi:hypothetical protein SAMN05444368_0270 [Acetomicrobium flavidum]|uniref:Uncharacterized protein n=1 Tax=Acetomicrobium flavidum TaxID=49896 RepID=A0ABY1JAZ7_9BACT|nr:hypothetical protein SAMN05444368_0270 [Acetomicrobium flavidum]
MSQREKIEKSGLLNSPLDQTGTQTTGAYLHSFLDTAPKVYVHNLQVDEPTTAGFAVRVADVISRYWAPPTTFTYTSH